MQGPHTPWGCKEGPESKLSTAESRLPPSAGRCPGRWGRGWGPSWPQSLPWRPVTVNKVCFCKDACHTAACVECGAARCKLHPHSSQNTNPSQLSYGSFEGEKRAWGDFPSVQGFGFRDR